MSPHIIYLNLNVIKVLTVNVRTQILDILLVHLKLDIISQCQFENFYFKKVISAKDGCINILHRTSSFPRVSLLAKCKTNFQMFAAGTNPLEFLNSHSEVQSLLS